MTQNMPMVPLGKNGAKVQQLGFGAMGLSYFYGTPMSDEERLKILDGVHAAGEFFWDTADIYGDSEDLLGKWFKHSGKRDSIFLATKFSGFEENGTPEYVKQSCARSLERLGTTIIDLFYCHRMDKNTPIEITIKAMGDLKREGKVRHIGLSECSANTLRRACAIEHVDAIQVEYSPWALEVEEIGLLQAARELGVAVVIYSPLGRGFLTGRFKSPDDIPEGDLRKSIPRFNGENFYKNLELADSLAKFAETKNCTPGQLTLAWLMAQGPDILPIPRTTSLRNLKENMGALDVKLSKEDVAEIRKLIDTFKPEGSRYGAQMMTSVYSDTPPLK